MPGTPSSGIAAKAYVDSIETLTMSEKYGVVSGIVRKAIVCGLTGATYATLYQALTMAGIPAKGTFLDGISPNLILTDRDVRMIDLDKAEVTLTYGQFNDPGQPLYYSGTISGNNVAGKMTTSIVQKETNLYRPNGDMSLPQELIVLTHTYPADDADYGGQTQEQTGVVQVQLPQRNFTIQGIKQIITPWVMAEKLIRSINADVWMGQPAGTWMCTEVTWDYRAYANYFMTFNFQHEEDGWNPTAVFTDDRTTRPPSGVSVDEGSVFTVPYFRPVSFVHELGFFVVGPAQS